MENTNPSYPNHLAWHETLELHELVASQAVVLMKLKRFIGNVNDGELRSIYDQTIKGLETNLNELLAFYPSAPSLQDQAETRNTDTAFYAGDLLVFAKTSVRNYAIAITETATPVLRETLRKQLQRAIDTHAKVFAFMYSRGLYPSYNLERLLQSDIQNASKALKMGY
ncbi:spore coat protein F [Terribacillus aidingensis]|uniref:Spore coat protein F n=1 Tax=Terribacillus aidingensis TaxID=586416 RepID=A0A285NAA6_9BACI|nr:spore coat protein [Terribacillus aidingensis]SNZ05833.1 spore coat protein F [Terribacillus aidingensis]